MQTEAGCELWSRHYLDCVEMHVETMFHVPIDGFSGHATLKPPMGPADVFVVGRVACASPPLSAVRSLLSVVCWLLAALRPLSCLACGGLGTVQVEGAPLVASSRSLSQREFPVSSCMRHEGGRGPKSPSSYSPLKHSGLSAGDLKSGRG